MPENPPIPTTTQSSPTNLPPSQAIQQTPPTIIVSDTPPPSPKIDDNKKPPFPIYFIPLIMLIIGIALGLLLGKEFPQFNTIITNQTPSTKAQTEITQLAIPKDAVQIETCEDNKGSLFIQPQNIPQGPIYMVYKGGVIGLEFMLNTSEIMQNKKFDFLTAENAKIDHVKFGYLSEGHEGNPVPHFHADLYLVTRNVEESIKCPPGQSQEMNMPGMDMNPSSFSATLHPSQTTTPSAVMQMH